MYIITVFGRKENYQIWCAKIILVYKTNWVKLFETRQANQLVSHKQHLTLRDTNTITYLCLMKSSVVFNKYSLISRPVTSNIISPDFATRFGGSGPYEPSGHFCLPVSHEHSFLGPGTHRVMFLWLNGLNLEEH